MNQRLIFFLLTVVLALTAALLVRSALKSKEAKIQALRQNTAYIVVAAHRLSPGTTLDSTALKLAPWPRDQVPPGAFTDFRAVTGKVVKDSLSTNQPVVDTALLEPSKAGGVLPLLIPDGMRAMSIAVDDVSDMAGFVLPHSRVDVLVSVAPGGGSAGLGELTRIVLQNIEVLAAAQTLEAGADEPHSAKVVTLLVTPEQAERLAAASRLGSLQLAMRNFADRQKPFTPGVSVADLFGVVPREPPRTPLRSLDHYRFRPQRQVKSVEVIRNGTDLQTLDFLANGQLRPSPGPIAAPTPGGPQPSPQNR